MRIASFLCAALVVAGMAYFSMNSATADTGKGVYEGGSASDLLQTTKEPGSDRKPSSKNTVSFKMTCKLNSGQVIDRGHPRFQDCMERAAKGLSDQNSPIPVNM